MAQEAVNAILQAFQNSLQMRMARDQAINSEADKEKERQFREREFKEQQAQNKIHQEAAAKLYDLQKAQLEAQQAQQEFSNAQIFQQTGITPPGAQVIPGIQPQAQPATQVQVPRINQSTPVFGSPQVGVGEAYPGLSDQGQQKPLVLSELQNSQLIGKGGSTQVVPPLSSTPAVKLAEQQRQQAEADKIRGQQLLQIAEQSRQMAVQKASHEDQLADQLIVLGKNQEFQDTQRRKTEEFQKSQQDSKLANTMQVAKLKATGGMTGFGGSVTTDADGNAVFVPNDPEPIIKNTLEQAENGQLTLEQVKKMFPQARTLGMITGAAQERGIKFMTDKQLEKLRELEQVASLTPDLYRLAQLRREHPGALQFPNPFNDVTNEFQTLEEKVKGKLAGVSKWLNSVPRFTNVELNKVSDAILPSTDVIHHKGSQEFTKYTDFVKDIQDSFNTTLSDIPENQKNMIRQRMGLNNYPYLGTSIQSPGTPTPQIGGSTKPTETRGGQPAAPVSRDKPPRPGMIKVIKKSTGKEGWLEPTDFDSQIYTKSGSK